MASPLFGANMVREGNFDGIGWFKFSSSYLNSSELKNVCNVRSNGIHSTNCCICDEMGFMWHAKNQIWFFFFFFEFFLPAVFCSVYYNVSALSQIQLVYSATLGIMHDCYLACRKVQIMLVQILLHLLKMLCLRRLVKSMMKLRACVLHYMMYVLLNFIS